MADAVKNPGERKYMTYLKTVDAQKKYQRLLAAIGRPAAAGEDSAYAIASTSACRQCQSIAVSVNKVAFC